MELLTMPTHKLPSHAGRAPEYGKDGLCLTRDDSKQTTIGTQFARLTSAVLAGLVLCFGTGCLNPATFNQASGGAVAPLAPGDTPFVLVRAVNLSQYTVDMNFSYDAPAYSFSGYFMDGIEPNNGDNGFVLPCPVNSISLGNEGAPTTPALTLTAADGGTTEVPTSAFPLEVIGGGTDFSCGDTVVFTIVNDRNSSYGIEVYPGRIEAGGQQGPFTGGDTFEILQLLLFLNGRAPEPVN
jgi:hypothetical protein